MVPLPISVTFLWNFQICHATPSIHLNNSFDITEANVHTQFYVLGISAVFACYHFARELQEVNSFHLRFPSYFQGSYNLYGFCNKEMQRAEDLNAIKGAMSFKGFIVRK